jgi:TRAP-type C4-dicarboxylate transport system substrate-binding protein
MIAQAFDKEGLTFVTWFDMGMRDFISKKRPIVKAEDMRGLKYRTMPSPVKRKMVEAWGAQPVFTDLGEVYSALETGGIDIMDSATSSAAQMKFHEVTRYLSVAQCAFVAGPMVMNKKKFDGLPVDIQKIVMECGQIASYWARVQVWAEDRGAVEQLAKLGMKVNYVAPEEVQKFRKLSEPLYTWAAGEYGKEFVERFVGKKIE